MSQNNKSITVEALPDTPSLILDAIRLDIAANLEAKQSGHKVAGVLDSYYDCLDWTRFKGNAGAAKCGMSAPEYKAVKGTRSEYKEAWIAADLPNFDQRWQYVTQCSEHYVEPTENNTTGKSDTAKLEEAIRAVYRHATSLEDEDTLSLALQLISLHGLEVKPAT